MKRLLLSAALLLASLVAQPAAGDGGSLRARAEEGPLVFSLLTAPTPVRVGSAEVGVLVQDSATGEPLPDFPVEIAWWPKDSPERVAVARAIPGHGANRLLAGASLPIPGPGAWVLELRSGLARVRVELEVAEAEPALADLGGALLIPPVGLAFLALHEWLRRRQMRGRVARHTGRQ